LQKSKITFKNDLVYDYPMGSLSNHLPELAFSQKATQSYNRSSFYKMQI
jgi:hypothetical protein